MCVYITTFYVASVFNIDIQFSFQREVEMKSVVRYIEGKEK